MNRQENVKKFEELLSQVDREGMPQLLEYIRDKSDFYTAPASTRFHLSTEGGLLQHSLNVYECLQRKAQAATVWHDILAAALMASALAAARSRCFSKSSFSIRAFVDPRLTNSVMS